MGSCLTKDVDCHSTFGNCHTALCTSTCFRKEIAEVQELEKKVEGVIRQEIDLVISKV